MRWDFLAAVFCNSPRAPLRTGHIVLRFRASLSVETDHADRAVRGRRADRRDRPRHGRSDAQSLGQTVVVENTTGAGGTIAVGRLARSAPDGYTIGIGQNGSHVITGATYPGGCHTTC